MLVTTQPTEGKTTMIVSERHASRLTVAVVGVLTTVATQRLLTFGWKTVTGRKPPQPGDPEATWTGAVSWAVASGIGIGMARLWAQRLAEKWAARPR
ncbi:MAG TPA: DUF4235 domain-containing protein [Microlunatus sp.]|nr:DUF4235 domain-containing protein [Microlunatus sp.]